MEDRVAVFYPNLQQSETPSILKDRNIEIGINGNEIADKLIKKAIKRHDQTEAEEGGRTIPIIVVKDFLNRVTEGQEEEVYNSANNVGKNMSLLAYFRTKLHKFCLQLKKAAEALKKICEVYGADCLTRMHVSGLKIV
uniref:Uncharacterized protein n=1 Tax=Vespula pensylvanica TaxID=30213 RepID=A0A834KK07_VESPE|nr:hypothetical protein H0235_014241 [Vespula pensylvanica]